jgi:hypothetical protein
MDELLGAMSLHCGQEEYEALLRVVETVDVADVSSLADVAARYDARIGDLVPLQRAELRAVYALFVLGHEDSAREMARAAFGRLVRTVEKLPG